MLMIVTKPTFYLLIFTTDGASAYVGYVGKDGIPITFETYHDAVNVGRDINCTAYQVLAPIVNI